MTIEQFNKNYDVFNSFLVTDAEYNGFLELPTIRTSSSLPEKVVNFSKAMEKKCRDFDCWIVFYEHDVKFERLWNNPKRYLKRLKKFKGVISPDFSLFRNMPLIMQAWNTYKGRALANWFVNNGVEVIPNVRFGDERTYAFCFDGIEKNKCVSVGTHGCIKKKQDREFFKKGLAELVKRLSPETIIVYGKAPDNIFSKYRDKGINIIAFESDFALSRKRGDA